MRVRFETRDRLAKEAELSGQTLIEMLDALADQLEERRLLTSMERSYEEHGPAIRAEVGVWDQTLGDGLLP